MFKAIKRLSKMGKIALIMIVQLTVGLTLLNTNGFVLSDIQLQKKNLDDIFNISTTYACRFDYFGDPDYVEYNQEITKVINDTDIFNKLKNDGLIKRKMVYYTSLLPVEEMNNKLPDKYKKLSIGGQCAYAAKILMDEEFFNGYDFDVNEGRTFTKDDFNLDYTKSNIPIILGKDFKGEFEIGEIIEAPMLVHSEKDNSIWDTVNFEVIGFLEDNAFVGCEAGLPKYTSKIYYSNSFSAIPVVSNAFDISEVFTMKYRGLLLEVNDGVSMDEIKKILDKEFNKYDLEFKYESLGGVDAMKEILNRDKNMSLLISFVVSLLAILGCISIIIASLLKRNVEFGAKLFSGATLKDITKEILMEIVAMVTISSIFSIILSVGTKPSINVIITNLILTLVISVLISIIPIIKLKRMQIIDIVKKNL